MLSPYRVSSPFLWTSYLEMEYTFYSCVYLPWLHTRFVWEPLKILLSNPVTDQSLGVGLDRQQHSTAPWVDPVSMKLKNIALKKVWETYHGPPHLHISSAHFYTETRLWVSKLLQSGGPSYHLPAQSITNSTPRCWGGGR